MNSKNFLGAQIRIFRYRKGWSQRQFAVQLQLAGLDISRSGVSKIEARIRLVTDSELVAILHVLGMTLEEILPRRESNIQFRDYLMEHRQHKCED